METGLQRWYSSPLGELLLEARDGALVGAWFAGQAYFGQTPGLRPGETAQDQAANEAVLEQTAAWLDRYFRGEDPGAPPVCRLGGTPFQRAVWAQLEAIPYGEHRSYGQIAAVLGSSARAVGGAVGRNPISILIPCHRVIGADGSLTGYAGGTELKKDLLQMEKQLAVLTKL